VHSKLVAAQLLRGPHTMSGHLPAWLRKWTCHWSKGVSTEQVIKERSADRLTSDDLPTAPVSHTSHLTPHTSHQGDVCCRHPGSWSPAVLNVKVILAMRRFLSTALEQIQLIEADRGTTFVALASFCLEAH